MPTQTASASVASVKTVALAEASASVATTANAVSSSVDQKFGSVVEWPKTPVC